MSLYTVDYPLGEPIRSRVLLYHLDGAMDAGHAGALAVDQLLMTLPSTRLITFDMDQLVDYRARRPTMYFVQHSYTGVDMPQLAIDLITDDDGRQLLLLHGDEPDFRWEEFVGAILNLVRSFGVEQAVNMTGMPLAVPHTRPVFVHHHGNRPELLPAQPDLFGQAQFPGPLTGLLELRLGEAGLDSRGLTAGIPHYVARDDYPAGAAALLSAAAQITGMALPVGDLEAAAAVNRAEIDAEASEHPEVSTFVSAMENQYDALAPEKLGEHAFGPVVDLPTADEIGARLEAFLEANDADFGRTDFGHPDGARD